VVTDASFVIRDPDRRKPGEHIAGWNWAARRDARRGECAGFAGAEGTGTYGNVPYRSTTKHVCFTYAPAALR